MAKNRQPSGDLVGFFMRVPTDLKVRIDAAAEAQGVSQAAVCVELIRQGLSSPQDLERGLQAWLDRVR